MLIISVSYHTMLDKTPKTSFIGMVANLIDLFLISEMGFSIL